MPKKVYLSPSNQDTNTYAYGNTKEAVQCGKIATACKAALERNGVQVMIGQYDTMANRCAASDKFGADLHVPIHTNACNGSVTIDNAKFSKSFKRHLSDAFDIIFNGTKCTSNDNSVSSKKRMTFREEEAKLHPERINTNYIGGVVGCPRDIETCPYILGTCESNCRACWDREIPDELMGND